MQALASGSYRQQVVAPHLRTFSPSNDSNGILPKNAQKRATNFRGTDK